MNGAVNGFGLTLRLPFVWWQISFALWLSLIVWMLTLQVALDDLKHNLLSHIYDCRTARQHLCEHVVHKFGEVDAFGLLIQKSHVFPSSHCCFECLVWSFRGHDRFYCSLGRRSAFCTDLWWIRCGRLGLYGSYKNWLLLWLWDGFHHNLDSIRAAFWPSSTSLCLCYRFHGSLCDRFHGFHNLFSDWLCVRSFLGLFYFP